MTSTLIWRLALAAAPLAALTSGAYAQQQSDPQQQQQTPATQAAPTDDTGRDLRTPPDRETLKRTLQQKAKRIPRRGLASALRARADERDARAQTLQRAPNLEAVRAELKRSTAQDTDEQASAGAQQRQSEIRAVIAAPPRPGIRAASPDRMKSASRKEIERVAVPLLLPADDALRDKFKVYGMKNVYTAAAQIDAQASLMISGTCNRVIGGDPDIAAFRKKLSKGPPRLAGTGASFHISRNDFGVDLSFSKFGCGYVLTIECGDPATDPRCAEDDYVTGLANAMILANPELAGGE